MVWQGRTTLEEAALAGRHRADKSSSPCKAEAEAGEISEGTEKNRTVSMSWRDWSHSDFFH